MFSISYELRSAIKYKYERCSLWYLVTCSHNSKAGIKLNKGFVFIMTSSSETLLLGKIDVLGKKDWLIAYQRLCVSGNSDLFC